MYSDLFSDGIKTTNVIQCAKKRSPFYFSNNCQKLTDFNDFSVLNAENKYQMSLTNPRDALHHGKRAANKGGRSV